MTEKIIIDGVNVSGCICLDEWKHCDICHTLIKTIGISRNLCLLEPDLRCETYPNCNYKQLQHLTAQYNKVVEQNKSLQAEFKQKEQECEELKKSIMKQCPICGETFLSPIGMELYDKNTYYKQTLDEIERITYSLVNRNPINNCWALLNKCTNCEDKEDCGNQSPYKAAEQILGIINKAKVGNNENT